jgi:hypothetical protein
LIVKRTAPLTAPSAALLALAALALPAAARADWLVTTEGGRVATRGPWEVKGKLVVFTAADGTLSSLRAAQVDLEASQRATAEAKQALAEAAKPPQPAPRRSVRTITDKDVGHPDAKPADAKAAEGAAGGAKPADGAPAKAAEPAGKSPVSVGTWQKVDRTEKDGVNVVGTLENASGDLQTDVALSVTLIDDAGGVLGTANAVLASDSIPGKESTAFKAAFPGVFSFARAKFDIRSAGLKLTLTPGGQPASPPADKPN